MISSGVSALLTASLVEETGGGFVVVAKSVSDDGGGNLEQLLPYGGAAGRVSLDDPRGVVELLWALRKIGAAIPPATSASTTYWKSRGCRGRCPGRRSGGRGPHPGRPGRQRGHVQFLKAHPDEVPNYLFGREPDGAHRSPGNGKNPAA